MASKEIKFAIQNILKRIDDAYECRSSHILTRKPLLVAVSKTKSLEDIIEAYAVGQRHFGENYAQEIFNKASNQRILQECKDIKWHFIGHLQTNKVNKLLKCPGLYMIETLHSKNLADHLNNAWGKMDLPDKHPLRVLLQVNVSKEDAKNGVKPEEVLVLYQYIRESLPNLDLLGLMTIGNVDHDITRGENPDFVSLMKCYEDVYKKLNLDPADIHLSMGMSKDFEHAIQIGSTMVRVGSSIFGGR